MISYILFNTLIYGSIAFILSACFAYAKYLHISIGGFMILSTYMLAAIISTGWSWAYIALCVALVLLYICINFIVIHYFPNEKQRDLFGLIFTLGGSILLENLTNLIYGSSPVSLQLWHVSRQQLLLILVVINIVIVYVFGKSYLGKIWKGIYINTGSIRALGVRTNRMIQQLLLAFLPGLAALGLLIANEGAMRASDNLFYIIKGIGIMIMVGVEKREFVFLGALLYVMLEYLLFIGLGLPIEYKETFILIIILVILLIKPQGLFSIKARQI